ncbi:methyltransferase domain-containing protein [Modestobacter sp. I12A-02628]|uniref:Class I SAM-dependent methyltransferase n=1 Tax=Goekera deserti TaxID=2497753 RepID=A0A7K3WCP3_9ACTN|nr:methyltransferase domain-containing protein [Goekera deserti]NDI46669.1 methyltransferase domain-containing protein [Goekera deserti]NEL54238.1 class I SAM-dependent methyltransferase [Goekera deserti]
MTLFRAFLSEQTDPDAFYGTLADDSVRQLGDHVPLHGATVLDVGGGPGYFRDAFVQAGATYVGMEPDAGELAGLGTPGMVRGSGEALPVRTASVDVCYSSNVLEHVARPWLMADEMVRVTKPGGTVFLSFTPWLSPHGGHETGPWHYLGGYRARRRYVREHGREPKNRFGESLFAVSAGAAVLWARQCPDADVVAAYPRYHPWWAQWIVRVPGLREVVSWNLVVVLRRREDPVEHVGNHATHE